MRLFVKLLSASAAAALLGAPAASLAETAAADPSAPALEICALVTTELVTPQLVTSVTPVVIPVPAETALDTQQGVDAEVLAEINFARAHPQDYAQRLLAQPVSAWERGLAEPTDRAAYAEAVAFLERQAPLPPLRADDKLAAAALEHVAAQGPAGAVGHDSPDGERFDARLRRHGVAARMWGENIAYGPARAADVVRELIIDSGVPDRGHRRNIFYAAFETAGVTCGPHRDYAAMCVMDFAAPAPERPLQPKPWTQAELAPEAHPGWGLLRRLTSWR